MLAKFKAQNCRNITFMQTRSRAYADFISFDLRKKYTYAKHVEIVCAPKMETCGRFAVNKTNTSQVDGFILAIMNYVL